jgi:penicillin-binding protein 1A
MDQATGYAAFANGGKRIKPHAALEVLNSRGELIYRFDRDGEQPQQVVAPRYIEMLDSMLIKVVEGGTGTRAALNGIRVGGKTGTTSDYKDAWFCGFTGNFVGAVWFGNDDDEPMIRATGGTMPAMTWHDIMQFAHSGVDLKPLPGATLIEAQGPWMGGGDVSAAPRRPDVLSRKAADTLGGIEVLMKSASARRALLDLRAPDVAAAGTDRGGGRGVIVELR